VDHLTPTGALANAALRFEKHADFANRAASRCDKALRLLTTKQAGDPTAVALTNAREALRNLAAEMSNDARRIRSASSVAAKAFGRR
jgi:hypothetical protein